MPLQQHQGIVVAGGPIVGCELEDGLEQQLRIVEDIALEPDPREQAHGLDVVAMLEQVGTDDVLRRCQLTVRK